MRFLLRAFLGIDRVGVYGLPGCAEGGFQLDFDFALERLKSMQD